MQRMSEPRLCPLFLLPHFSASLTNTESTDVVECLPEGMTQQRGSFDISG